MTNTKQIREELGHDGLVLWQPFKNWAMARNWNLDDMSPNELDEYYALFKAGHDHGQQALVAENEALKEQFIKRTSLLECLFCGQQSFEISPIDSRDGICWNEQKIYTIKPGKALAIADGGNDE